MKGREGETICVYMRLLTLILANLLTVIVPYFLRSWVLLLRIKSAMKIKTNLQMTGTTELFFYF